MEEGWRLLGWEINFPGFVRFQTKDDLAFLNDLPQEMTRPDLSLASDRNQNDWNSPVPLDLQLNEEELGEVASVMGEIEKAAEAEALEDQVASEIESVLANRNSRVLVERHDEGRDFLEAPSSDPGVYSEGGLVFLKNPKRFLYEENLNGADGDDEEGFDLRPDPLRPTGFERRERLDVKKPGPWYRTVNNFAFDKRESQVWWLVTYDLKKRPICCRQPLILISNCNFFLDNSPTVQTGTENTKF